MKKIKIIIPTIIVIIIIAIIAAQLIKKEQTIKEIKNNYNQYITTNKNTNIYDSNNSIVGQISENTYLELEEKNQITEKDKYFKIKDSEYYVYYKDINKSEQIIEQEMPNYYVDLGKQIKTNETTNLYQNEDLKISINNSLEFNVKMSDENYYYITYIGQTFKIKKEEILEINDIDIEESISSYISVLNYETVQENCETNECVTYDNLKEQLNYLKENEFYTININDYKLWLNDNINLKEKAILITSTQDLNEIAQNYNLNIEQDYGELTYSNLNTKSEKGNATIPTYNIIKKTTLDIFKQITNGENITYVEEKPIIQTHTLPSENGNATQIAVLNYHFFFDPEIGETCPDGNCKTVQDFEQELNYLKQNNYKTLTMDEFTKWMYGEIELPARSVLITIDDGAMGTGTHNGNKLIPLLEKYQTNATLFLITGWWPIGNYSSPYLDIESHTFDMHEGNYCDGEPRGSKLLCSTKEQVLQDLKKSTEITGSKNAFCFPMYVYNDTTLEALQEIGFKLAFIGGDYKATRNNEKYKIPRYHMYRDTTLDQFINMIS